MIVCLLMVAHITKHIPDIETEPRRQLDLLHILGQLYLDQHIVCRVAEPISLLRLSHPLEASFDQVDMSPYQLPR